MIISEILFCDDPDGWIQNKAYTYNDTVKFLQQYISPYLKHGQYRECTTPIGQVGVCMDLLYGGLLWFSIDANGGDIVYIADGDWERRLERTSRKKFQFQFAKKSGVNNVINSVSYIEPYIYSWNGKREHLKTGGTWACKKECTNCGYCTKLIQLNSWKILSDYPW